MSLWRESLHPRDYRGRFKKGGSGTRSKKRRPTRGKRIARGANTLAQTTAASLLGAAIVPGVGGVAAGYVVLNRRRNAQIARGETGLRSTMTGRRLN